ncbi:MAG: hypothetical protein ACYCZ0_03460 [Minisyncoccota bacterium]
MVTAQGVSTGADLGSVLTLAKMGTAHIPSGARDDIVTAFEQLADRTKKSTLRSADKAPVIAAIKTTITAIGNMKEHAADDLNGHDTATRSPVGTVQPREQRAAGGH